MLKLFREMANCFRFLVDRVLTFFFFVLLRAAEILDGINTSMLDEGTSFTQNDKNLSVLSPYHTPYENTIPPLSEFEYNKYQYAKSLFQIRQFYSVQDVLRNSKSPKLYFLRLYAKYLVKKKKTNKRDKKKKMELIITRMGKRKRASQLRIY